MTLVNIEDESDVIVRLFTNIGSTVIEIPKDYTIVKEEAEDPAFCPTSLLEGLNYSDFEFDAETGHYVPKEVVENEPYSEVLFDENGLLVSLFIYNDNLSGNPETEGANLSTMIGFNNTETPVIEVPEYTIVE